MRSLGTLVSLLCWSVFLAILDALAIDSVVHYPTAAPPWILFGVVTFVSVIFAAVVALAIAGGGRSER